MHYTGRAGKANLNIEMKDLSGVQFLLCFFNFVTWLISLHISLVTYMVQLSSAQLSFTHLNRFFIVDNI